MNRTCPMAGVKAAGLVCALVLVVSRVGAHCEIPCGIYGDRMRMDMLAEHVRTVEKSMRTIKDLSGDGEVQDTHQLIRWVVNKEEHASHIQEIVYQYFMNQRVTPVDQGEGEAYERYVSQITLLHNMLVQAMKCKQSTDESHVKQLRSLLDAFDKAYFDPSTHEHK